MKSNEQCGYRISSMTLACSIVLSTSCPTYQLSAEAADKRASKKRQEAKYFQIILYVEHDKLRLPLPPYMMIFLLGLTVGYYMSLGRSLQAWILHSHHQQILFAFGFSQRLFPAKAFFYLARLTEYFREVSVEKTFPLTVK